MSRSTCLYLVLQMLMLVCIFPGSRALSQEAGKDADFYDVEITNDQIYTYSDLKFAGNYFSLASPAGQLALGDTVGGVTVVVIMGDGTAEIQTPEAHQEKCKTIFGNYPLKLAFKTIYLRLHPKEYEEVFEKQKITKAADKVAFEKAKELFDQKFMGSYHAGTKALFPPYKTRYMEFETPDFGQITFEGYWLKLRRLSPYGSVFPSNFVNPKQR